MVCFPSSKGLRLFDVIPTVLFSYSIFFSSMETEIDQLFYWQTHLTRLGGVEKTMAFFFEEDERKHIWHVFEKEYLIPLLERSKKKVEAKCKALDGDAEAQR